MANWDLWSSPYVYWDTSDDPGSPKNTLLHHFVEPGSVYWSDLDAWLRADCRYNSGGDLMEESAMNEKSCIQVLKILIPKADTEIDELEKELVCLQSELAWAEHEHWSRICLKALRENTCFLSFSIKNLKSKDPTTVAFQLQMFKEPAEHIHEILKPVLRKYFPERDEQNKQASEGIALKSSLGSSVHASTGLLDERGDPDNSKSITVKMEEPVEIGGGDHGERCVTLKLLENNTNDPQNNSGRPE